VIAARRSFTLSGILVGALIALVCVRAWVPVTTFAHFRFRPGRLRPDGQTTRMRAARRRAI
jgi:hypothetical protein